MAATSDCGHLGAIQCECTFPPTFLCSNCYWVHVMSPTHPNVNAPQPLPGVPPPQAPQSVLLALGAQFDSAINQINSIKLGFLRRVNVAIQKTMREIAEGREAHWPFAYVVAANTYVSKLQPFLDKVVEEARNQSESYLTLAEGLDLHKFPSSTAICTTNSDFTHNNDTMEWKPLIHLSDSLHLNADSFWLSISNTEVAVCNTKPAPCYNVNPMTGEVQVIGEMRETRRAFGLCVATIQGISKIFAIGGTDSADTAETYVKSRKTWVKLDQNLLTPRSHFQPVFHQHHFYLIGGSDASVEIIEESWNHQKVIDVPKLNIGPTTACALNGRVMVIWGMTKWETDFSFNMQSFTELEEPFDGTQTAPVYHLGQVLVLARDGRIITLRIEPAKDPKI